MSATEAKNGLDEILNEVQRQPIVIREQDQDVAVVLSAAQYERLRTGVVQTLLDARDEFARDAAAARRLRI